MAKIEAIGRRVRTFLLNSVVASELIPARRRSGLLRRVGIDVGKLATVYPYVTFLGQAQVRIGDSAFVNRGVVFDASAPIDIGRDVHLGHDALLVTSTHQLAPDPSRRAGRRTDEPIRIEDGCWLGARVTVLPGVIVGAGSVVAAGAVVVSDLPANGLYGGIPARLIRVLPAGNTSG